MTEPRHIAIEIGDPPRRVPVMVSMCESSVSLDISSLKTVVHIPWSEISCWISWLADNMESQ